MVLGHGIKLEAKNLKVVYEEIQKAKKICVFKPYSWCSGNHNTGTSHYTCVTNSLTIKKKWEKVFNVWMAITF